MVQCILCKGKIINPLKASQSFTCNKPYNDVTIFNLNLFLQSTPTINSLKSSPLLVIESCWLVLTGAERVKSLFFKQIQVLLNRVFHGSIPVKHSPLHYIIFIERIVLNTNQCLTIPGELLITSKGKLVAVCLYRVYWAFDTLPLLILWTLDIMNSCLTLKATIKSMLCIP